MSEQQQLNRDDEARWQAVLDRDAASDGVFVYAVRSTGIFCRPSCPSRRPRREQVSFFPQPAAAARAGFRPCRRCRPEEPAGQAQVELVRRVCQLIDQADAPPTLEALGAEVGLSPYHLQRLFKRAAGVTPRQYAQARRLGRLKNELQGGADVTHAQFEAGYGSSSRLYEQAPSQLGMTPATYRRGGAGLHIRYTVVPSRLGALLVAATERGICAVSLGDSPDDLARALREEYPAATVERAEAGLDEWIGAILGYLDGRAPDVQLPLDIQATAFQRQVWQQLQAIPRGSTWSYRAVAAAIGRPEAARAVAGACAANPVALLIPCHRVVREGGELGGYRWGIERKQALLEQETHPAKG